MNGKTTIVTKAAEFAFQRGVSTFTAAGNEGNNKWQYIIAPADGFNIIAVGAVNDLGMLQVSAALVQLLMEELNLKWLHMVLVNLWRYCRNK